MKTKFSGRRPVMFYQPGLYSEGMSVAGPRTRIIYPNGTAEWCQVNTLSHDREGTFNTFNTTPCWLFTDVVPTTLKQAIALANKFDKENGFPKMEFLGEL